MVAASFQTNIPALRIVQDIRRTDSRLQTSLERITTGLRINRASDDPRGFVVSNRLESQFRGLNRAAENVQEARGMTDTAIGSLTEVIKLLQDIRDDALGAANTGVLDLSDRLAFQASIEERINQIRNIAERTRFGSKNLLNGSFAPQVRFTSGTRAFGGQLAFGPNSANLLQGEAILNLAKVQDGDARIRTGGDSIFNTGIRLSTDLAVSVGQFVIGGGDLLTNSTYNTVEMEENGRILFSGVLANGRTEFSGSLEIGAGTTVNDLIDAIQARIDAAETDIGVNTPGGTGALETNVALDANSRLAFSGGAAGTPSQFNLNLIVENAAGVAQTQTGITRSRLIGADATGALIGNSLTAITGSTFPSGTFDIEIFDVLDAERRQVTADRAFYTDAGLTNPVVGNTNLLDAFFGNIEIEVGDVIQFSGVNPDGTTFSTIFTVDGPGPPLNPGDGIVRDFDDLIAELNYRDRSAVSSGFNGATATLVNGAIQIIDDIAQTSLTDFSFTVISNATPGLTETSDPSIDAEGRDETASFRLADGEIVQASAGEVITLTGNPSLMDSSQAAPQLTLRVGRDFTAGIDRVTLTAETYEGRLNNGQTTQFFSGQKGVTFFSGKSTATSSTAPLQFITMDFDSILDVTTRPDDGGEIFRLNSTSRALSFRMGANADEDRFFLFADIRPDRLGLSANQTLDGINVVSLSGANAALDIVDAALAQVNLLNARFGAFSARLESAAEHLGRNALDIEDAHNRIVSTDLAGETVRLARSTLLLEAQTAVLAQANTTPERVFRILYGLDGR